MRSKGQRWPRLLHRSGCSRTPGDLLDLDGKALRATSAPGKLPVDGRPRLQGCGCNEGGRDRREPLVRRGVLVSGAAPSNPQFTVSRASG